MTSPSDLRRSGRVNCWAQGFSLLEMLVVLAITGLMIGVAAPALRDVSGRRSLERSTTEIAAYLRDARVQAVLSGSDTVISLDLERRRVDRAAAKQLLCPARLGDDRGQAVIELSLIHI